VSPAREWCAHFPLARRSTAATRCVPRCPLRKVLLLAQSPQTFSDHRSFLPCYFACSQTKAGTEWTPILWLLRAGIPFHIRLHIARCQGKQH
jgi:hypothetical protein